jgi:hypothetical protein
LTHHRPFAVAAFLGASLSFAIAPASAQQTGPGSWVRCAVENGTCRVPFPTQVRYGARSHYVTRVTGSDIGCNNRTFGDPLVGVVKACDYFAPKAPAPQKRAVVGSNCPAPGSLRSQNSSRAVKITVANSSFRPLKIYWLDYNGGMKFYRELAHGQSYVQSTYAGHPWVAVDRSGKCVGGPFMPGTNGTLWEVFGD